MNEDRAKGEWATFRRPDRNKAKGIGREVYVDPSKIKYVEEVYTDKDFEGNDYSASILVLGDDQFNYLTVWGSLEYNKMLIKEALK
jgi:hypothetical protein